LVADGWAVDDLEVDAGVLGAGLAERGSWGSNRDRLGRTRHRGYAWRTKRRHADQDDC
jgi:hypothetical protein